MAEATGSGKGPATTTPTTTESTEAFRINRKTSKPLKDENNYAAWTIEIQRILRVLKLRKALDKANELLVPSTEWEELCDRALITIIDTCENDVQTLIVACETAWEAWNILKEHFEGRTRTHLTAPLLAITTLKYDDRKQSISEHISAYETKWNILRQTVASETAGSNSQAASIKHFINNDAWKASMLLASLPHIALYQNIVDNITRSSEEPLYSKVVLRLRELSDRSKIRKKETTNTAEPSAAFASEDRTRRFCGYCKKAGWPGTSHNEIDCKWKKRDANKASTSAHTVETAITTTSDNDPIWKEYIAFMSTTDNDIGSKDWYIDSCATVHITNDINDLTNIILYREAVKTGAGMIHSTHRGTATVNGMRLYNVLLIPSFPKKLINVGDITAAGGSLTLSHGNDILTYQGNNMKLTKEGKLWKFPQQEAHATYQYRDMEWHERYGHVPFTLFSLISEAPVHLRSVQHQCEACIVAKSTKPASPQQFNIRTSRVGELIHSDLCGPMPVEGIGRQKYIVTLVDDYSRFTMAKAIHAKSDAAEAVKDMIQYLESMASISVHSLRTDYGGEFKSTEFRAWLRKRGIVEKPTIPHHSQTNSVAERANRWLVNMIRTCLYTSPKSLWPYAMEHSIFIKNRLPHRALPAHRAPIEVVLPTINIQAERGRFRPFGQKVWSHTYANGKFADRAEKASIIGYTPTYGIYKVILQNRRVTVAKNPVPCIPLLPSEPAYIEVLPSTLNVRPSAEPESTRPQTPPAVLVVPPAPPTTLQHQSMPGYYPTTGRKPVITPLARQPVEPVTPPRAPPAIGVSSPLNPDTPWRKYGDKWPEAARRMADEREAAAQLQFEDMSRSVSLSPAPAPAAPVPAAPAGPRRSTRSTAGIPPVRLTDDPAYTGIQPTTPDAEANLTIAEALASPETAKWQQAMQRELEQLQRYSVYEWVDEVPAGAKVVDTKWVLREKEEKSSEDPKRYKVRLTARGFTQRAGIDYHETYAPVCREESWRILICLALARNMLVRQFDIEGAFLNGPLQEVLYVKDVHATGQKAWRLKKSLYGTKQAAHNWNRVLDDVLTGLGFIKCPDDPGLYYRASDQGLIIVHVDDLLVALASSRAMQEWIDAMNQHFTMEDRGTPKRLLGMDISWDQQGVHITGQSAIQSLAKDEGITRTAKTPYLTAVAGPPASAGPPAATPPVTEAVPVRPFQALVGRLLFIARMWRPDVRYAVQRLCIKASKPTEQDQRAAIRIIQYLLGSACEGVTLNSWSDTVDVFTDAGEEVLEDKATSGILVMSGNSPISWTSRKQDVTTLSSTEAEYIALGSGAQDAMWLRKILEFLEVPTVPRVWTDNRGASTLSYNPDFHKRTKHIRRRHHFVRECAEEGDITVHWVPGDENPADMLTKPVPGPRLTTLKHQAGMTAGIKDEMASGSSG